MRAVNQELRKAIRSEGRVPRLRGLWCQLTLTERRSEEPPIVSLLRTSRDRGQQYGAPGQCGQAGELLLVHGLESVAHG